MRVLVFQHLAIEHPGILRDFMRADGIAWDTVELDEGAPVPDDLARWDALLVMGGPMDVWQEAEHPWLAGEKAAIRRWVRDLRRPYLGICLGHQLLADALGGVVDLMAAPEVGVCRATLTKAGSHDPVTAGFGGDFDCLQWHGAAVTRLPTDAETLATGAGGSIQALRAGPRAWGIQFHVEITADTVPEWSCVPAYADALRRALGADGPSLLRDAAAQAMPGFNAAARRLYDGFMRAASDSRFAAAH